MVAITNWLIHMASVYSISYGPVTGNTKISWLHLGWTSTRIRLKGVHDGCCAQDRGCLLFWSTWSHSYLYIWVCAIPSGFDTNWHSWFWHTDSWFDTDFDIKGSTTGVSRKTGVLTLLEHLIPLLFWKEFVDSKLLFFLFSYYFLACFKFVLSLLTMHFWSLTWVFYTWLMSLGFHSYDEIFLE